MRWLNNKNFSYEKLFIHYLNFSNQNVFNKVVRDSLQLPELSNFYSLLYYYTRVDKVYDSLGYDGLNKAGLLSNMITIDRENDIIDRVVEDDRLASFLNPEGFIQIGDTVFRITNKGEQAFVNGKLVRELSIPKVSSADYLYAPDGHTRFYVKRWYRNYWIYATIGGKVILQQKLSRHKRWKTYKAEYISLTVRWDSYYIETTKDTINQSKGYIHTYDEYVPSLQVYTRIGFNGTLITFKISGLKCIFTCKYTYNGERIYHGIF